MKSLKIFMLFFGFLLMSCNESKPKTTTASDDLSSEIDLEKERTEIQGLIKNLYKWHELVSTNQDFIPILENKSDTNYAGLDIDALILRLEELRETNYFSLVFIENYLEIGTTINRELRNKTLVWEVGGYPPFGNGANPWCNCQDIVKEYWEILSINNLEINAKSASFSWTWDGDFNYKAHAIKVDDQWQISYLEGFDLEDYIK